MLSFDITIELCCVSSTIRKRKLFAEQDLQVEKG